MLIIDKDTIVLNTEPENKYFIKALKFKELWDSKQELFPIKTSGSTGTPKEIFLTRQQLISSAELTGKTFNLQENNTALCCLNIEYIAGMMMLVRGFVLGLKMIIVEPKSNYELAIGNWQLAIHDFPLSIDFFAFVPLQMQKIMEDSTNISVLNNAKAIILGGAAVNDQLLEKIQEIYIPVYATYGMTETVTHIAIKRLNGIKKTDYFEVLKGVKIDKDERDCLKIKSKITQNQWITTNDIIELIDKKKFCLIGRYDNIINSGGVKIQLEKVEKNIEAELQKVQFFVRFFAYGISDEQLGQKLILVVETEQTIQDKENLFKNLPKFERPKEIYYLNKFIETPSGKIDKNKTVNEFILHKIPNR